MIPMGALLRLILIALISAWQQPQVLAQNYAQLEADMSTALDNRLRHRVRDYLHDRFATNQPFKLKTLIVLSADRLASAEASAESAKPEGLIAAITVHLRLDFRPPDPSLDIDLKKLVERELYRGIDQTSLLVTKSPVIRVNVSYRQSLSAIAAELRRDLVLAAIATAVLFLLFLIARDTKFSHRRQLAFNKTPNTESVPIQRLVLPQAPPSLRPPTVQYQRMFRDSQDQTIDPTRGSWYLHALPRLRQEALQHAFETMPFQEAMAMLRSVSERYRIEIAQRLELQPALRAKVLEEIKQPTTQKRTAALRLYKA